MIVCGEHAPTAIAAPFGHCTAWGRLLNPLAASYAKAACGLRALRCEPWERLSTMLHVQCAASMRAGSALRRWGPLCALCIDQGLVLVAMQRVMNDQRGPALA
jgi:hypothetical protein